MLRPEGGVLLHITDEAPELRGDLLCAQWGAAPFVLLDGGTVEYTAFTLRRPAAKPPPTV